MKNIIGLLLLIGLAFAAYWLISNQGEINKPLKDLSEFAIEDTASVDKIFISNLEGKEVLITRRGFKEWKVNGEYKAREDAIELLLRTAHDILIQAPVSKEYKPVVIKQLATSATKVEFYAGGNQPIKTWYIGFPTASKVGTYMLLETEEGKSANPYITHLLMERGSLKSRFFMDPILWRDRAMLRLKPENIKAVQVEHRSDTMQSFRLEVLGKDQYQIINLETDETFPLASQIAFPYLEFFRGVYYEYIDFKTPEEILDSIFHQKPRHRVQVIDNDGNQYDLRAFDLPVKEGATLQGKPIYANPERMYAYSSELGHEVHAIVQNLTFDKLLPSFEDLLSSTTVEK